MTEVVDEALIPVDHPEEFEYVWGWYLDLCAGKPLGFGPSKIPFTEYVAWEYLNRIKLTAFEYDLLRKIDELCFDFALKQKDVKNGS